jgi:multiple sugar transport system permease protein
MTTVRKRRILLYAVLVIGVVPTLLPFVWLVRSALMDNNQMFIAPPQWIPRPFEWSNFSGALTAQPFARYFLNTMIIEVSRSSGHCSPARSRRSASPGCAGADAMWSSASCSAG